jgi:hypothetical protein
MYEVVLEGEPIGRTRLDAVDAGMAVAMGRFEPAPAYERVAAIFRRRSIAIDARRSEVDLQPLYAERDRLNLALRKASGRVVRTEWIMIYDLGGDLADLAEVEVRLLDLSELSEAPP